MSVFTAHRLLTTFDDWSVIMASANLTVERLRSLLDYNPTTGALTWRVTRGKASAGAVAGTVNDKGYRVIGLDGTLYRAQRLAWFYVHAQWPDADIDHIDGNRDNNAYANLRAVSRSVNMQNLQRVRNRSGLLGVSPTPLSRWTAAIAVGGVTHYLGTFDTPEAAHEAYLAAKRRLHPGHTLGMHHA